MHSTNSALPAPRYTGVSIALHWVLALALVGIFVMGTSHQYYPPALKVLYQLGKCAPTMPPTQ